MRFKISIVMCVALICAVCAVGAAPKKFASLDPGISKIFVYSAIVPIERSGNIRTCPVCGQNFIESQVLPSGVNNLNKNLIVELRNAGNCVFMKPPEEIKDDTLDDKTRIAKTIESAKNSLADAALIPIMLRYSQLVGRSFAASKPAEVAFHLHLFKTADATEIWDFSYNEYQQMLSENLLGIGKFIKRRGKWVKADVILQEGILAAAKEFPMCEVAPQ